MRRFGALIVGLSLVAAACGADDGAIDIASADTTTTTEALASGGELEGMTAAGNNCIQIDDLSQGAQVSFPLTITGVINPNAPAFSCQAFHEGEGGFVAVQDENGNDLQFVYNPNDVYWGIITATGNWMVAGPVSFAVTIPALAQPPSTNNLKIIFSIGNNPQDNPPPPLPDATFILNVTL